MTGIGALVVDDFRTAKNIQNELLKTDVARNRNLIKFVQDF